MNPSLGRSESLFMIVITGSPSFGAKVWTPIRKAAFWIFGNGWKTISVLLWWSVEYLKCCDVQSHTTKEHFATARKCQNMPMLLKNTDWKWSWKFSGEIFNCGRRVKTCQRRCEWTANGQQKRARTAPNLCLTAMMWCFVFYFFLTPCSFIYIKFLWGKDNSSCSTAKDATSRRGRGLRTGIIDL